MLTISKWLTLIAVAMVPLSLLFVGGVIKASGKHFAKQQDLIGNINGYIEEMYKGSSVVSAFGYHERAKKRFAKLNGSLRETAAKVEILSGVINPVTTLVNNVGYVVSAVLGCFFVFSGKMPFGSVQARYLLTV